jgi:predicted TIM-barrel fold metal-dependent hydrolase
MFIDIHVHTRRHKGFPRLGDQQTYASPQELIDAYDRTGIERGVILPGVTPECSIQPQSNEEVLEIVEQYSGRFIPFCNVDPRALSNSPSAPLERMLCYYRERGCKGIGEVTANLPITDPMVQNLFRSAEIAGLPLTFHLAPRIGNIYGLMDEAGLPGLEESLKRFPKLLFFAHSQTFWAEMGANPTLQERLNYPKGPVQEGRVPQLMRQYPNLYGDLSAHSGANALIRDRAYARKFLEEFQDRLFFGTDICQPTMPTLRTLADFLLDLRQSGELSEAIFQKVARENAIRVLAL